jgi:predicted nucleotidyltransferase
MRLSEREKDLIREKTGEIFGEAEIYLFGSRMLPQSLGGDIDLFVVPRSKEALTRKRFRLAGVLEMILQKPVDVVVARDPRRRIEQEARRGLLL